MEFRDFYELAAWVIDYEELLKKESYRRKLSRGEQGGGSGIYIYYKDIHISFLVEKAPDLWKKTQIVGMQVQYIFEVAKIEEIFDFLVKKNDRIQEGGKTESLNIVWFMLIG